MIDPSIFCEADETILGLEENDLGCITYMVGKPGRADNDRSVNRALAAEAFHQSYLIGYGVGNFGIYAEKNDPTYAATGGKITVNNQYFEVLKYHKEAPLCSHIFKMPNENLITNIMSYKTFAISKIVHSSQFLAKTPIVFIEGNLGSSFAEAVKFSIAIAEPSAKANS